jgi:hypothetical protein
MISYKRIIVAGSRTYTNKARVFELLDKIAEDQSKKGCLIEIVSGLAKGPDMFGKEWAHKNDFTVHEFPANWDKYGKRAGYLRNVEMAEFSDALLAFHVNNSRGTKHMIDIAYKNDLQVAIVTS